MGPQGGPVDRAPARFVVYCPAAAAAACVVPQIGESIANNGREFVLQRLRPEDVQAYWDDLLSEYAKVQRPPTIWTILEKDGPNHLGLWCNVPPWAANGSNNLGLCAKVQRHDPPVDGSLVVVADVGPAKEL